MVLHFVLIVLHVALLVPHFLWIVLHSFVSACSLADFADAALETALAATCAEVIARGEAGATSIAANLVVIPNI